MNDDNAKKYCPTDISLKEVDFIRLYNTYYRLLCRFAKEKVNIKEDAEDIVGSFFLKLLENKEKIHITGKVSSYLYKGVYNTCLEYFKHIKVERNYSEQISTYNNDEWLQISDNNNPESMLIVQEMANEIENAIKILPEQCRRILLLWDEGLSYQEIAKKMGVSAGTVSKQLNRVFVKIRNHLKIKGKQKY